MDMRVPAQTVPLDSSPKQSPFRDRQSKSKIKRYPSETIGYLVYNFDCMACFPSYIIWRRLRVCISKCASRFQSFQMTWLLLSSGAIA